MRLAGSPKEYSCASEGEENAALYNMACCWAALGQRASALTVLEALLDNNFADYAAIRADPDLAPLRGPELDKLLARCAAAGWLLLLLVVLLVVAGCGCSPLAPAPRCCNTPAPPPLASPPREPCCRHDGLVAKLFGGGKKAASSGSGNKPWLQW